MLANLNEVRKLADEREIVIGVFNIVNFKNVLAVLDTAERLNMPAIFAFAQTHEENSAINLDMIGPVMVLMAQCAKMSVVVHPDHGINLDYIEKSLKIGFTSAMFDDSALTYEEDIRQTEEAVVLACKYGVSIEAEVGKMIGVILSNEGVTKDRTSDRRNYADPTEAKDFVERTGVDYLACSFGTVHGEYFSESKPDFNLVKELKEATDIPIVMHGGSGISHAGYKKVITNGVRKINYFMCMDKAGGEGVDVVSPVKYSHDAAKVEQGAM